MRSLSQRNRFPRHTCVIVRPRLFDVMFMFGASLGSLANVFLWANLQCLHGILNSHTSRMEDRWLWHE